jgi:mannose-6-phosphate isomerase-like protein (cupin superfamily)
VRHAGTETIVGQQGRASVVHWARALSAPGSEEGWGSIAWLTNGAVHDVGVTVGYVEIHPGAQNPLHIHPNCSEVLVLLEGALAHVVGDDVIDVGPGDMLIVPPGTPHRARNVGSIPARMLVVYDAGMREFEPLPDALE